MPPSPLDHAWWKRSVPLDYRTIGFAILEGTLLSVPIGFITRPWRTYSLPDFVVTFYLISVFLAPFVLLFWSWALLRDLPPLQQAGYRSVTAFLLGGCLLSFLFPAVT